MMIRALCRRPEKHEKGRGAEEREAKERETSERGSEGKGRASGAVLPKDSERTLIWFVTSWKWECLRVDNA